MTGAALKSTVYALLGVPSTYSRLTAAQIYAYGDAALEIAALSATPVALQVYHEQDLAAQAVQTLELEVLQLRSVQVSGVTLKPTNHNILAKTRQGWATEDTGAPAVYVIEGVDASGFLKLRLVPAPGAAVTNGLAFTALAKPTSLATIGDNAIVEFPSYLIDGLAQHIAARSAANSTERFDQQKVAQWNAHWSAMLALYTEREAKLWPGVEGNVTIELPQFGWE